MAIGCVRVERASGPSLYSSEEIASVAALAKRRAKHTKASGFVLIDADENVASCCASPGLKRALRHSS
jgi:hypothetical protein